MAVPISYHLSSINNERTDEEVMEIINIELLMLLGMPYPFLYTFII